jgi:hypothetical protein
LLIATLVGIGVVLAFAFLRWGEVWGSYPIFDLREGYGLYTYYGIPGVLLGLIAPLCLFAAAAFVALSTKTRK